MDKLNYLINELIKEDKKLNDIVIPDSEAEKKLLFRALCNIRNPKPISDKFLKVQDEYLKEELENKKITDAKEIIPIFDKICLWKGDITTLKCDAIVNAGNEYLLGCFIPNHHCIDNAIHFYSGIQLRLRCNAIMQGRILSVGEVKLTPAYNLPSKYIIHTVGPIIYDEVEIKDKKDLANCYINSLEIAKMNNIRTIAFPCISTGEYNYPQEEACLIAVNTIEEYLKDNNSYFDKIIFNVFTDKDFEFYNNRLSFEENI